ncbi:MAG: PAS domain-containing protein, partial [Parafilimonas terrae]|nr:PAS domain-containing protein [Parafilimonas terrae]
MPIHDGEGRPTLQRPESIHRHPRKTSKNHRNGAIPNFHDVLHHHHEDSRPFPAEECVFVQALRNGQAVMAEEATFFRQDGQPVPVECTSVPFHLGGKVSGAVITVTDI